MQPHSCLGFGAGLVATQRPWLAGCPAQAPGDGHTRVSQATGAPCVGQSCGHTCLQSEHRKEVWAQEDAQAPRGAAPLPCSSSWHSAVLPPAPPSSLGPEHLGAPTAPTPDSIPAHAGVTTSETIQTSCSFPRQEHQSSAGAFPTEALFVRRDKHQPQRPWASPPSRESVPIPGPASRPRLSSPPQRQPSRASPPSPASKMPRVPTPVLPSSPPCPKRTPPLQLGRVGQARTPPSDSIRL